jgi:Protein of unknown function (DUF1579)
MSETEENVRVRSVVAGLERATDQAAAPGPKQRALDVFIGKWITTGHTVASPEIPATEILASDTYEWAPGGFFVVHSAYGRIGDNPVGGVEIMYYDADIGSYRCQFFDNQGNITTSQLDEADGAWSWTRENTRCRATFTDDGKTQVAHHQHSDDDRTWRPSMEVTLNKIST